MRAEAQVTTEDAASLLGLSRRQVYRQLAEGLIPAKRLGRKFVIYRADVERLLTSGTTLDRTEQARPIGLAELLDLAEDEEIVLEVRIRRRRQTTTA